MSHPFHPQSPTDAPAVPLLEPWLLYIRHRDMKPGGYFRPEAWVCFKAELRTSGFWELLPAPEFKDWLLLLSFLTPNGDCGASLEQLAEAMGVTRREARRRMERLEAIMWQGKPLMKSRRRESGQITYHPAPGLLRVEEEQRDEDSPMPAIRVPVGGSRRAVVEHSRKTYARPRAEVEREIARINGWPEPLEDVTQTTIPELNKESNRAEGEVSVDQETQSTEQYVREQLGRIGLNSEQVNALLTKYDLLRIRRQLAWLPYREVRKPAGFIVAAIEGDYEAPLSVKIRLSKLNKTKLPQN